MRFRALLVACAMVVVCLGVARVAVADLVPSPGSLVEEKAPAVEKAPVVESTPTLLYLGAGVAVGVLVAGSGYALWRIRAKGADPAPVEQPVQAPEPPEDEQR